ncbi:MAG: Gfo/Idh/MocA family oxidoreductase [Chloroflexi bacterium]|nr:Gfo/Idh/MocA family oxidoreductase [Chloroflexota bacterium]
MISKLRAAVIGVGVGWNHLAGYQASDLSECVAICDANPQILNERGEKHNIPQNARFTDYQELLANPNIDAVSVCVPNFLHEPIVMAALQAGKHVLCEKPLATTVAAAQRMIAAAKAANRLLMVCYNHRYRPDVYWLKQQARAGVFGHIYAAKAGWMREGWIPTHGSWFTQKDKAGGGVLIDLGVHALDLALWLMDYPQPMSVSGAAFAEFGQRAQKHRVGHPAPVHFDVEDMGMGFVRFADGSALALEASWAAHREPQQDDYYVRMFGREAGANVFTRKYSEHIVELYTLNDMQPRQAISIKPDLSAFEGLRRGHHAVVHHFADCIVNGVMPESPAEHGLIGLQIVEGIYQSSQSGSEVKIK